MFLEQNTPNTRVLLIYRRCNHILYVVFDDNMILFRITLVPYTRCHNQLQCRPGRDFFSIYNM